MFKATEHPTDEVLRRYRRNNSNGHSFLCRVLVVVVVVVIVMAPSVVVCTRSLGPGLRS